MDKLLTQCLNTVLKRHVLNLHTFSLYRKHVILHYFSNKINKHHITYKTRFYPEKQTVTPNSKLFKIHLTPPYCLFKPVCVGFVLFNLQFSGYFFVKHCLSFCSFFCWPLYCLSFFDLQLLITLLVIFVAINSNDYSKNLILDKIKNLNGKNKIYMYKFLKQNENEMEYYLSHPDRNVRLF